MDFARCSGSLTWELPCGCLLVHVLACAANCLIVHCIDGAFAKSN